MSKQAAQNTTNQITEGVIWKQLLIFFFPILFGTFFQQLYNTADAIIVGNFVGKEALARLLVALLPRLSTCSSAFSSGFLPMQLLSCPSITAQTTGAGSVIPFIPLLHWRLQAAL